MYETMRKSLIEPAIRIGRVVNGLRNRGELQRVEGVDHDGQFFGAFGAQAFFDCAGVRAVGDAAWMERQGRLLDATTTAEIAVDVVEQLVAIDVAVVIRNWYRERVIVQFARHEGTDHEIWPLEGLVYGRRLVDAPGNRLEVGDIE